jgi:putative transposase
MPRYVRGKHQGGSYFFTVSTYRKQALLTRPGALEMLRTSLEEVRSQQPFSLRAWVVLPDHGHFIWTLPPGDDDYPGRWDRLKAAYTRRLFDQAPDLASVPVSWRLRKRRAIWQRGFRAHRIIDPEDFTAYLDYLHYNPVKHGLAASASAWRFSSFHTYVERGFYGRNWGGAVPLDVAVGQ